MIGWLSGQIVDKQHPGKLVIDVNGVGYDVETSLTTFFNVVSQDKRVGLHIHTVVREDALLLYGFVDKTERTLFRSLIKVNGIGPKLAIAVLSSITVEEFIQCIHEGDAKRLVKLPGIGKKTAERLVVEMRDSIDKSFELNPNQTEKAQSASFSERDEAIRALESLGYKYSEAKKVIYQIDNGLQTCEQLIRNALKKLASHRP
ncbi:Holliday junction branch migration protein RuvA [Legionella israelensis]|uniref:Holliday junction branch migration complex subunit RuvA n=1 Tax=Legionella israelensis TaxID=454 RepID=A0A0W0VIE2_9GAMM|nr:Holliday junction branch migration protein RuvA [Legionella israelensis]KTD19497.1 Holliday junction DNA helicase RuvA [Legionella israelensis]QBS08665.1 Holliday junction branch migration protein RuvA [Legionella israelensis]SCY46144.1 Holliday junction DNA helicase subunit RuvA [Legionella israelensis DSM 19235]STX58329.1 Holliday junction ATP-dependent DNA helicase RuvA [Legionella israelensis]